MEFEELDGLVNELFKSCKNKAEWNQILSNNPKLQTIKTKWTEWWNKTKVKSTRQHRRNRRKWKPQNTIQKPTPPITEHIYPSPFTEEEQNYLNSKLIDGLSQCFVFNCEVVIILNGYIIS